MKSNVQPITRNIADTAYPQRLHLLIDGQWLGADGRNTLPVINPATGETLAGLPCATRDDLDHALEAAGRAYPKWRAVPPHERGRIMKRAADLLRERGERIARIATIEEGKSIGETRIDLARGADLFEFYGEEVRRTYGRVLAPRMPGVRMTVLKEPIGPVAAFAPWNFPIGNPCRKLGAPVAAGCPVILKPAEETPASALEIARCLADAGVPDGVVNVVFGVPAEISSYLLKSPVIRKLSFTGSTRVGRELAKLAAERMIRTTMELGGHAPVLVFDDVDVDQVLDASVQAKYRNAGQVCVSPTRYYIHENIYQRFVQGFAERARAVPVGDGLRESTQMGPLAHAGRPPYVESMLDNARQHGAHFHTGGSRIAGPGYFFEPTVISDVPNTARIMNEEPFGPIAILNPFSSFEEAIQQANRLPYGLAAYAFTGSPRLVNLLGEQIEAGMIGINSHAISVPESPFGGMKESGHGSEEGPEGLDACYVTKFVSES